MTTVLRSAKLSDIDALLEMAQEADIGITTLPRDQDLLLQTLERSVNAFAKPSSHPTDEIFLFALEHHGEVIGVSGLLGLVGESEPFYVYQRVKRKVKSAYLSSEKEIEALHFLELKERPSEIRTLYLKKAFRQKELGKLLSFGRFVFVACHPHHFSPLFLAEMRGVIKANHTPPFWEGIGAHFFPISFLEADRLRLTYPQAIGDLFPRHPIYVDLLPQSVQAVLSQPHKNTVGAKILLERQGFATSDYIDIFDGGPHLYARRDTIVGVKETKIGTIGTLVDTVRTKERYLLSNTSFDFRALICGLQIEEETCVRIPKGVAAVLQLKQGDTVRYLQL